MRWLGVVMLVLWLPAAVIAAETPQWEFGLRGGTDATGVEESYFAGELYLLQPLPWRTEVPGGTLETRLDIGVSYLEGADDHSGWLALGGDLVWSIFDGLVDLEAGFRPAWLFDKRNGNDDFGGEVQFSSHAGVALHLAPMTFSYRIQHLSNAGLFDENDGLDLHLFGIGARF